MTEGSSIPSKPVSVVGLGQWLAIRLIRVYQLCLSPFIPARCRYLPTCSDYSITAINRFGLFKGSRLAASRVCRCHPWGGSGVDEVPQSPDHPNNV
ncbi:MAG: membrane protein insertion efficiency factor YidD [Burkholderiaceae bacterium]